MSLSAFEKQFMSQEDQQLIMQYKQGWERANRTGNKAEMRGYHNMAEQLRRKYSFSGGGWGDEYIPVDTYKPPQVPDIPQYQSRYSGQMNDILNRLNNPEPYRSPYERDINQTLDKIKSMPEYKSPYEGLINQYVNKILNRPDFKYNPDEDVAFQAYKKRAYAMGEEDYQNVLGGYSANTGGRLNSWASTMASKARNNRYLQAEQAMADYENKAFQKYQWEVGQDYNALNAIRGLDQMEFSKHQAKYNNSLNLLNSLQAMDTENFNRYRQRIGDTKDLARFVMELDNRDFNRYQAMVENTWKKFEAETSNYQNALNFKRQEFNKAVERTNMLGYVNNEDSYTLGLPAGTPSFEARKRSENMEDFMFKSQYEFESWKKKQEASFGFQKDLLMYGAGGSNIGSGNKSVTAMFSNGALKGKGNLVVSLANKYGIPPELVTAIIAHETGFGTSNALNNKNNPAGYMDRSTGYQSIKNFNTIDEGLEVSIRNMARIYKQTGGDLKKFANTYAPVGAKNDPKGLNNSWYNNVNSIMKSITVPTNDETSVVRSAKSYKGVPYKLGGNSRSGIDCSALIQRAYENVGIKMKGRLTSQALHDNPGDFGFMEVPISSARPGDIVWHQGHLALYNGDGTVTEASSTLNRVAVNGVNQRKKHFTRAYRHFSQMG